ncbi:glycosyltransferase family 2 protein [Psychroflexus planctonicus]|uniref:Glycosyltransferase 2-like domain-containing protein n=1 Tax=Psychroflexus planctonicus TaxID=1526575 RepID=A0ABQ1SHQ6_9FLAO|nr:glycosyltransferase family 2 protein [Psychroflexus planctonicus]GGE32326.1 hypothetical protein GCM10010832_10750 [Psychroflexus planctonicus]
MREQPLVSIIIPTYNRAHLIGETLDSVLAQTYPNWECIIVDDGSTDNTDEVVGAYVEKDARFKYYHRPEEHLPGGNGARNFGFKMSKGEYVNWLDSDDLLSPYFLSNKELEFLNGNFDAIVSLSQTFNKISGDGSILWNILPDNKDQLQLNNLVNDFLKQNMLWPPIAIVWKKTFFDKKKELWNEHLKSWQDWEFHIKMLLEKPNLHFKSCDIDTFYRIDSSDKISTKAKDKQFFINLKNSIDAVILLLKSKALIDIFSSEIKNLIARVLIRLPIQNGYYKFSLLSALKYTFFLKSLFPIKSLILELARQYSISRKISSFLYKSYKEKIKFDTTFMKLTKENLK